jgi:hypothetical protein
VEAVVCEPEAEPSGELRVSVELRVVSEAAGVLALPARPAAAERFELAFDDLPPRAADPARAAAAYAAQATLSAALAARRSPALRVLA